MDFKWLIGILAGFVLLGLTQLGVLIWFLSGMSNKVGNLAVDVQEMRTDLKSVADQGTLLAVHDQRIMRNENDIAAIRQEQATMARSIPATNQ